MTKEKEIVAALEKAETGRRRYLEIMARFPNVNVSTDDAFQRKFNGFYKIRRNRVFRERYYSFMETQRKNAPSFTETVRHLGTHGNLEASFASKLLATINPNLPVWDKYVLRNTCLRAPAWYRDWEKRVEKADNVYQDLIKWYTEFVSGEEGKRWIQLFDERYPETNITPVKKIDFVFMEVEQDARMNNICISPEFLKSLMDLPKQIQRKTIDFIEKFSKNPNSPGINYERINTIGDKQLRSGRIDREYRAIIYEEKNGKSTDYHLLWAGIHEPVYRRAEQIEAINQLIASRITIRGRKTYEKDGLTREHAKALFAGIPHDTLLYIGVPLDYIRPLKELKGYNGFKRIKKELETSLPKNVCETLELIALGEHVQKIADDNRARRRKALDLIYEKVLDPGIACDGIDEDIKESLRNTKDRLEKKKTIGGVIDFYYDALQAKQGKKIAGVLKRHNIKRLEDIQDEFEKITLSAIDNME